MNMTKAEAIAKIQCDYGVNGVCIRPVSFHGWAILHQKDQYHAETVFSAETKEECQEVLRMAAQEVAHDFQ